SVNLLADAIYTGNGGKVVVWSNLGTQFNGSISAHGGILGGNGGWVETSGKSWLDVSGARVNTFAVAGNTGSWLLDPTNIYIALDLSTAQAAGMAGSDTTANTVSAGTAQASGAVTDSLLTTSVLN